MPGIEHLPINTYTSQELGERGTQGCSDAATKKTGLDLLVSSLLFVWRCPDLLVISDRAGVDGCSDSAGGYCDVGGGVVGVVVATHPIANQSSSQVTNN